MKLKIAALIITILGLLGFFLPWAKPVSFASLAKDPSEVVKNLISRKEPNLIFDYFLISGRDLQNAFASPAEGASGLQLALAGRDSSGATGEAAMPISTYFFGHPSIEWEMKTFWLIPVLIMITAVVFFLRPGGAVPLVTAGAVALLVYMIVRWRMTEATQIQLEMTYGIGLWLSLYAVALLGIFCLISPLLPVASGGGRSRKRK